ncbi:regulatory subunit of cyclin-dependent kinase [Gorgonomyces haynaldii]|nr:regulatory subunit of cyclin-dependent kinase [Gorgonomyces haynaldii]
MTKETKEITTNLFKLKDSDPVLAEHIENIHYSDRYDDGQFEYRHVIMPKEMYNNYVPSKYKGVLLSDAEWRSLGMCQSPGWIHFLIHDPEPNIFVFRREMDVPKENKKSKKGTIVDGRECRGKVKEEAFRQCSRTAQSAFKKVAINHLPLI